MPRLQVYLADDLYDAVKSLGLSPSELLQDAVRAEMRRRSILREGDRYLRNLIAEVGPPSSRDRARAAAVVSGKPRARARRKAG